MPPPSLSIAIIGCGTGGPAAAALLARQGHRVTILERAPALAPIGAGILLQPSGLCVLAILGVLDTVLASGARITHLRGVTRRGRVLLDLRYADLRPDLFGLGVQRGLLFTALLTAAQNAGVHITTGVEALRIERDAAGRPSVRDTAGAVHGPFDLLVVADGARSALRTSSAIARRDRVYPFGAAWFVARDDPHNNDAQYAHTPHTLSQVYGGTSSMVGMLPSGRLSPESPPTVSLFWSLRMSDADALRAAGAAAFRRRVLDLAPHAAAIVAQIDSMDQVVITSYHDVVCRSPVPPGGRVVYIGDAAHAMSPQLGQGANLALADAFTLAECINHAYTHAHTHTRRDPLAHALKMYTRRRRGPISYYTLASRWLTPVFQSEHNWLAPPRDALFGPMCRFPPARRQMLLALAGVKTGVLSSRVPPPAALAPAPPPSRL